MYAYGVRMGLYLGYMFPQTVRIVITTQGDVGVKRTPHRHIVFGARPSFPCRLALMHILQRPSPGLNFPAFLPSTINLRPIFSKWQPGPGSEAVLRELMEDTAGDAVGARWIGSGIIWAVSFATNRAIDSFESEWRSGST